MNPVFAKANRGVCYPNWIFAQLDLMLLNPFAFTFTLEHRTLATKLEKLQKNVSMTYACVILVCLDVALREGDLRPSVIPKEHLPTSAAYS